MSRTRTELSPELPTPISSDADDLPVMLEDGLVPPAGIAEDAEFERVVNIPD